MKAEFKKMVMKEIENIYPNLNGDAVVLTGSRAKGLDVLSSDIDILIFSDRINYYKKISFEKKFRRLGEDAGFEFFLDEKILLEVKIVENKVPKFDVMFVHDILNAVPLSGVANFNKLKKKVRRSFLDNYNKILMKEYINFYNEFKQMEGIAKRSDELSLVNLQIKKGVVLQALFRLILIMQKEPYTFDKWLYHMVVRTKYGGFVRKLVPEFNKIRTFEDVEKWKSKIRPFVDGKMPKRAYVGAWWKFLKEFKELK